MKNVLISFKIGRKMNFNSKKMFSDIMLIYSTLYQCCHKIEFLKIFFMEKGVHEGKAD